MAEMTFAQLIQTVGLPIAMLLVALVTVLKYFIEGKVVPRWVYDAHIKERDEVIIRQAGEIKEWRSLALNGASIAEQGVGVLRKVAKETEAA